MARTCVFCEADGPLEREHIVPQWVARLLPDLGKGMHRRTGMGAKPVEWYDEAYKRTAKVVCRDCNGGWMSDQEKAIAPILSPILLGEARTFKPPQARRIAKWAFTRALIGAARVPNMPREPYTQLRETGRPRPRTKVWFGGFATGPSQVYSTVVPLKLGSAPVHGEGPNGYMVTFSVGHTLFHVFGNESGRASPHGFKRKIGRAWTQIWPVWDAVPWPPELFLDEPALDALAGMYGGAGTF